jgi:crotonobetainyl-CoA:carnitine CoA-transferase CaiB-like acyl-CoA transferase
VLEPADVWCSDVYTWHRLFADEGFQVLDMVQEVVRRPGVMLRTTRCPIRIDGQIFKSPRGAPALGEHTADIIRDFALNTDEKPKS